MRFSRIGGLGLLVGAVAFVAHVVLRSIVTAGVEPSVVARQALWVPLNALGLAGAALVLLALPSMYSRVAEATGAAGLAGVALIAVAWLFFGVFLSSYGMLIMPWLAESAPELLGADVPPPRALVVTFLIGLVAWVSGTLLLAIPFIRNSEDPHWIGYLLVGSGLWMVLGNLVIAPSGPSPNLVINLLSNLGPVLLLVALAGLGWRMAADAG
jgi:hypothetical protein